MVEQERRSAIIVLVCAGHSAKDIIFMLKSPPATVYAVIKRFKARGSSGRSKQSPRSDKKRTPEFLSDLDKSITANPGESMTSLTKRHSVHHTTILRAIRHDLGYKSYALQVRHLLTAKMKDVWVTRCKKILNSLKSTGGHLKFISDKVFTLDRKRNRQNDRWICKEPSECSGPRICHGPGHHHQCWPCHASPLLQAQGEGQPEGVPECPQGHGEALDGHSGCWGQVHLPAGLSASPQGQDHPGLTQGQCHPLLGSPDLALQQPWSQPM